MDVNLFWFGQEESSRLDLFLPPDTPVSGTQQHYDLLQKRSQRIVERVIRCHAHELQACHNDLASHFDRGLHDTADRDEPLLEFTDGRQFLRENQGKLNALLQDMQCLMHSEYEEMDISDDDAPNTTRANTNEEDEQYHSRLQEKAEIFYNEHIQMTVDSQQARWEYVRRYIAEAGISVMEQVLYHRQSLAPQAMVQASTSSTLHKQSDRPKVRQREAPTNSSTSTTKPPPPPPPPQLSLHPPSIPKQHAPTVTPHTSTLPSSSRVPMVVSAFSSEWTGRSNRIPDVSSSSRAPDGTTASSWAGSFYRPCLAHSGKISIKRMGGKGAQVVYEKKNEPVMVLGSPQQFSEALYGEGSGPIKVATIHKTRMFQLVDDRGKQTNIAEIKKIEPMIKEFFLNAESGEHHRML